MNVMDQDRLFFWSLPLTFDASIDFCMEALCIQLFGVCKSEFINNGNFLQCTEINHEADGMIRHDQEIKVEKNLDMFLLPANTAAERREESIF